MNNIQSFPENSGLHHQNALFDLESDFSSLYSNPNTLLWRKTFQHIQVHGKLARNTTILHCAAAFGSAGVFNALFAEFKGSLNVQEFSRRMTPLHWAIKNDRLDIVQTILAKEKVDPDIADNEGWTPLHWAVFEKKPDMIRALLADGRVCPNQQDSHGRTALHNAIVRGNQMCVEELLSSARVVKEIKDGEGYTPLALAVFFNKQQEIASLLRCSAVNVNERDHQGWPLLNRVALYCPLSTLNLFLARRSLDPNQAHRGDTALHWLVLRGEPSLIEAILQREDVRIDIQNARGQTPEQLTKNSQILRLFAERRERDKKRLEELATSVPLQRFPQRDHVGR